MQRLDCPALNIEGKAHAAMVPPKRSARAVRMHRGEQPLSILQQQVLIHVAQGYTNKEIAGLMDRSTSTIHDHAKEIFRKLGVGSRAEAAVWACKAGLV